MVGFLSGFFKGKKADGAEEIVAKPEKTAPAPRPARAESSEAYFLDMDKARTMGDVEYMRTAKTVRRTFPKTLKGKIAAFEQSISSNEAKKIDTTEQPRPSMQSSIAKDFSQSQPAQAETERRRPDSSMDMFRNMAKDMRK
jgi:hypothetical protein